MKKRLFVLSALALFLHATSWAYDFSAKNDDGVTIYYNISGLEATVTYKFTSYNSYSGTVVIPETVTYNETTYTVTSIGYRAFYDCSGLTSVTIPNSVTTIGELAFNDCSGLTEVTISDGVTTIDRYAFESCTGLTSVTIPESVTEISDNAFFGCSGLTKFEVAEGNNSYCSVDGVLYSKDITTLVQFPIASPLLPSFDIPDGVTTIGRYAFEYCSGLTSVTIPKSVTKIGDNAFFGCSGLTELTIPESVTEIGDQAFYNCTGLTEVNFNATSCTSAGSSNDRVFGGCKNLKTAYIGDNVISIPSCLFYNCTGLAEVNISESVTSIGDDAFANCSSLCSISNTSKTQLTCTMRITSNISGAESGIVSDDKFYSVDDDGYCTFTDLIPGNKYSYYFGVKLPNDSCSHHSSKDVTTTAINPKITQTSLTPDTYTARGSYTEGDAVVTETGFTGYTTDGVTLSLTNLNPNGKYTVEYYVKASGNTFTTSATFTTPALEFTTLPAKATSNTVALLGATTNLSDEAEGTGFEWRRNDAPSTMPSNQAECPVIDGELTGTLNGLSATTYYDFRPYYTSATGYTYYGDWMTFITADAYVYFEPTVRTYEATGVGSGTATLTAYAVSGSDGIVSSGFEYWAGGDAEAREARRVSAADGGGVTRVEVSGQRMTVTLEDLEPGTTYSYRAYATTAVGTTYGETMTFTTDMPTGVEATPAEATAEVREVARYTLDGKRISRPQRGLNIVRYSDGTVKKVLVK